MASEAAGPAVRLARRATGSEPGTLLATTRGLPALVAPVGHSDRLDRPPRSSRRFEVARGRDRAGKTPTSVPGVLGRGPAPGRARRFYGSDPFSLPLAGLLF